MYSGVDGLLREKTRPPGIARTADEKVAEVIHLTQEPPPHEATHWTIRAMGKAVGLAASTVRSIWKAHGLSPHRWRQFKLSNDPAFANKLRDVVGLYVSPPAHAVVLSIDEKSQIQALDRTQPGLPLKKGRGPTMTHDYKRNGTTTLFAALNVLDGSVIGRNMQRHRHQEFIRFLNQIERVIPAGKIIHVILDNYCTHKHAKVRAWLERHSPHSPLSRCVLRLGISENGYDLRILRGPKVVRCRGNTEPSSAKWFSAHPTIVSPPSNRRQRNLRKTDQLVFGCAVHPNVYSSSRLRLLAPACLF